MSYTKVVFTFSKAEAYQQDLLTSDLADAGFDTFEDIPGGFAAFISSSAFSADALTEILDSWKEEIAFEYEVLEIPDENWNEEWEKNFEPLIINQDCYVRATFHEPQPQYKYEIVIDPKMAFGTGHHQTTTMMMQYLLTADLKDKEVLDMGCGTGILAILASKLGAKKLIAIDNDPACYNSTLENVELNNTFNVEAGLGGKEAIPQKSFDIIVANINRNILLDQMEVYASVLTKGGSIYFSGFYLDPDLDMIKASAKAHGLAFQHHKMIGEWVAAHFIKL